MFWVLFLLPAWAGALFSCGRLVAAATAAAGPERSDPERSGPERSGPEGSGAPLSGRGELPDAGELSLYEAAYLAGGPQRVVVLTLLSMQRQGRLLLARSGWATVVDPVARDELERCVLGAFGPDGQSPVAQIRSAAAAGTAVRDLAHRLARAGLAVPERERLGMDEAVRGVKAASALIAVLGAAAVLLPQAGEDRTLIGWWFALPLVLTLSCLGVARFESHPYSPWASPAGQQLLVRLDDEWRGGDGDGDGDGDRYRGRDAVGGGRGRVRGLALGLGLGLGWGLGDADDRALLAAVAVRGLAAVKDPDLRAALCGERGSVPAQRRL
ncbi:TIGR04222 domain-containing membrane protein [Streptomyces sp. NRRL S-87]|uniref:TIGR04222 domain-containing membrane protein n=1 Tax=Streptomyces sp. NRRL S-87 TaxID=1463920 RepID=UPI0004BE8217|nr:TIGR04222 domain-containing membrane protein [Streptomyces sp. NRRL S-87]